MVGTLARKMGQDADLLIENARVYTLDAANPHAAAVAVAGNRIVWVGDSATARAWRGASTRVIDGQGCTLLPGLIDSHFHLGWGVLRLDDLHLERVRNLEMLAAALGSYAQAHPAKPWLRGQRLAYDVADDRPLTRHDLDAIVNDRPVALTSSDFHAVWANTRALEVAGILHGGETAPGSEIVMGTDGTATGQLNEHGAFDQVLELVPPLSEAEKIALLKRGLREIAAYGITSVHNMDGNTQVAAWLAEQEAAGALTLRVYLPYSVRPETPLTALATEAVPLRDRYRTGMVRAGAVKFFMDGVIESFTAFMLAPYANRLESVGDALWSADRFTAYAVEADRLGLQIAVHAIGDAAVRRTLDGFAAAQLANGRRDSRHRIEHIELLHPDDRPRFAALGVAASMQPYHATRPEIEHFVYWAHCVGQERWAQAFPWQDLRHSGARLVFGSDWPIVTCDPLQGIDAAVNRQPWAPGLRSQAQPLAATLAAYTCDAAWLEFQEQEKGVIRPGCLADLVLLDADLFATAPEQLIQVRPVLTVVDGHIVHES